MSTWTALLIACGLAFVLKFLGYVVPASWLDGERTTRVTSALPIALLAALVGVQTLTSSAPRLTAAGPTCSKSSSAYAERAEERRLASSSR